VALETRIYGVEGEQFLPGKIAASGQGRIKSNRRMALRHDKAVALRPVWLVGPDIEHMEIEGY
jgi:hypothetical protein